MAISNLTATQKIDSAYPPPTCAYSGENNQLIRMMPIIQTEPVDQPEDYERINGQRRAGWINNHTPNHHR
jgi:hypothetical protein